LDIQGGSGSAEPSSIRNFPLAKPCAHADGGAKVRYVVSRQPHPRIGAALDIDTYCALDHILVSHGRNASGMVDRALEGAGRIAMTMPQMLTAFAAVARSDALFTAPASAVAEAAARFRW
jgi:hypothetical protein